MSSKTEPVPHGALGGRIVTPAISMAWSEAPWDSAVFGSPVLQISELKIRAAPAASDIAPFLLVRDEAACGLVSCRLPHDHLRESMFLEDIGFRFVEMLYQPECSDLGLLSLSPDQGLVVARATEADLPELLEVAGRAFGNERFHVDPRIARGVGDRRYQNWVRNSLSHASQRGYVVRDMRTLVAFFVVEHIADGTCYWHLNAVAPAMQGKGYGMRAWRAMMDVARKDGARRIRTSIVARNHRVLNLYARLGFCFPEPSMTFHWVRSG